MNPTMYKKISVKKNKEEILILKNICAIISEKFC